MESDVPVVVEEIRRYYTKGISVIMSNFATMAQPIGDQKIE
jgi:hypothetical protein